MGRAGRLRPINRISAYTEREKTELTVANDEKVKKKKALLDDRLEREQLNHTVSWMSQLFLGAAEGEGLRPKRPARSQDILWAMGNVDF